MLQRLAGLALLALMPRTVAAQQPQQPMADLIVTGARIYTVDQGRPMAEGMAVKDGRVLFVGSDRGALTFRGPSTRVLDLDGRVVIPGMVDAHAHLTEMGERLRQVDLVGTTSYEEVIDRVKARAAQLPDGAWVVGGGWDQNDWGSTAFPTAEPLSRAVPDHPVILSRVDGHAVLVNDAVMKLAGITSATPDPEGGRIVRLEDGSPSGVFVDNAQALVYRVVPPPTREETRQAILAAVKEANRWGLTGVHDPGVPRSTIDLYEELAKAGKFTLRDYVMVSDDSAAIAHYFARGPQSGLYDGHLWIRAIKLYADGALGSRGAALLDPYSDDPHNHGLLVSTPEHIEEVAEAALRNGFQVATHAIGDRANREVLDEYEKALKAVPVADHRFRIEHAQILSPQDIPRFAELDVIPSMQAVHATSDMYWAAKRLGESRMGGAYAWRSLLDSGVIIPNGSDFPVERVNPLYSFHAAVTRQDENDYPPGGWYPAQRMTREEALKAMTIWPAYAGFQEEELGSLSPGKYADFVVLDRDIMTVAPEDILDTHVLATYVGGEAVYERK
ncbi:MAG TPA: amidohydrolase family protein [Longimicrobiaceae bacterium]|nr:amidohydrolase family protein [Longimicrobiaceae bacterium]